MHRKKKRRYRLGRKILKMAQISQGFAPVRSSEREKGRISPSGGERPQGGDKRLASLQHSSEVSDRSPPVPAGGSRPPPPVSLLPPLVTPLLPSPPHAD